MNIFCCDCKAQCEYCVCNFKYEDTLTIEEKIEHKIKKLKKLKEKEEQLKKEIKMLVNNI